VRFIPIALVVVTSAAHATSADPFLDIGFGKAERGLQLAVTVPADGAAATFRVKNTGSQPVTFVESFSCSGPSPWSISAGASSTKLEHHWNYEPTVKGLTTKLETACTRNVPIKRRTVAAGDTISIVVSFATAGEIMKSTDKAFQANALLDLDGRNEVVVIQSAVQTR
jgi:hypothetical protein